MRLTLHTDYGLRMLMSLAVIDDRVVTIDELAKRHGVSKNHLMKVAQTLVGLGLVTSVRALPGKAGACSPSPRPVTSSRPRLSGTPFGWISGSLSATGTGRNSSPSVGPRPHHECSRCFRPHSISTT